MKKDLKQIAVIIAVIVLSAITIAAKPVAQVSEPIGWETFLKWLSTPSGVVVALSFFESAIAEKYFGKWFHDLEDKWKQLIFFGVSIVVPVISVAVGVWTVGWTASWDVFWYAIQAGALAFSSGTIFHGFARKKKP